MHCPVNTWWPSFLGELLSGSDHALSSTWPPLATDCAVSPFLLQPAKLAEAFKYFVQGMGYSKYGVSRRRWAEGRAVSGRVTLSARGGRVFRSHTRM